MIVRSIGFTMHWPGSRSGSFQGSGSGYSRAAVFFPASSSACQLAQRFTVFVDLVACIFLYL
jgi:hypothetical protein